LHEFTPAQCTISPLVALLFMVPAQPDKTSAAAPIANMAPLLTFDGVAFVDSTVDILIPLENMIFKFNRLIVTKVFYK
jgi:hypothetical protein